MTATRCNDGHLLKAAVDEARKGLAEGGIPIGSVLVHEGRIIGRGHNRRVQRGSAILHGEMDALENAGRQTAGIYQASAISIDVVAVRDVQRRHRVCTAFPVVVVGENRTFRGEEEWPTSRRRSQSTSFRTRRASP